MLNALHGSDLAVGNADLELESLEALGLIDLSSGSISSLNNRSLSSSLLERIVDTIGSHGDARLNVDLGRHDILSNQSVETSTDQICAEARSFVVLSHVNGHDLASSINFDSDLHRLEALRFVDLAGSSSFRFSSLFHDRLGNFNDNAVSGSSLLQSIGNRIGSHGNAGLCIDLHGRDVLANQISQSVFGKDIRTEARSLIVHRSSDGSDCAVLNRNIHGELVEALNGVRIGRNLRASGLQSGVDGLGGHGHASLDVDLGTGDILANQSVKACTNQIRTEARSLIVLENLDRNDFASVIHSDLDLDRAEAVDIVGVGGDDRLNIARSSSGGSQNGFLIARGRRDAERILGISQDLSNRIHERGRGNRCAADGIDVITQSVRISSDGDELIFEVRLANFGAQTSSLLKSTDISLSDATIGAYADGDRDRSAVTLRSSSQRIADNCAGGVLTLEDLVEGAALGQAFIFNLGILAARKHGIQRFHLSGELLGLDRALGHFVGHRQSDSGHKCEHEETKRELKNTTHYFLTSPKLLVPVTRSISGDTTFISRMAKEHHSAGAFLPKRNQNSSRPQPRPKMSLPFAVVGEDE